MARTSQKSSYRPFRRYTNLAATIHLLRTRTIALLNPATWDDRNDAYFMAEYKRYKQARTVLALCFAQCPETYHHWRVFSHGPNGVCIDFDKERLLAAFRGQAGIRHDAVAYRQIRDARAIPSVDVESLPFLKRAPYSDEREYRIVYTGEKLAAEHRAYDVPLSCIRRITLSPWMPQSLSRSVIQSLRAIEGCRRLPIVRSTLVENETWKSLTAKVRP
jgi:hypothetical protein